MANWIERDPAQRLAHIQHWTALPDFASVNVDEPDAVAVSEALLSRGIGVEAGISTEEDVATLRASGLAARLLRVLIEPVDEAPEVAVQAAERVIQSLDAAQIEAPRLLHGSEAATWPMLRQALARGYDTRIGFEDTLLLPSGAVAQSNAELVVAAVALARDSRR